MYTGSCLSATVKKNQLQAACARDLSPIRHKKVAEATSQVDEIVKVMSSRGSLGDPKTGFSKVKIESTHSIEITDFVEQVQINPKFFYKPYFWRRRGGEKPMPCCIGRCGFWKIGIARLSS